MSSGLSIVEAASLRPEHPGLIVADQPLWFAELADRALVCAAGLYEAGADELALVAHHDAATAVALYAALEFGIPTALLHERLPPMERAALLARTPRAFAIDSGERALPAPNRPVPLDRVAAPLDTDVAFTVYTSGTSGRPRGVLLSRRAVQAAAAASAVNLGWLDDDRWLCCLPLAHVGGLSILTRCLHARATAVLGPPRDLGAQIERHRITLLSVVPTLLERLCADADAGADVSSLRAVLVGGAPCPPALFARARAAGIPALLTYGMTETCSQIATMPVSRAREPAMTAPWPPALPLLPGVEVRIGSGTGAAREDRGRVAVRGPMLMNGYAAPDHRPPAIAPMPDRENDNDNDYDDDDDDSRGWFDTGDLGRLESTDAGLALVVLGRADALIITGGENVMPQEVEAVLLAHPAIAEACVVGAPDPHWGEVVVASIALAPTATDSPTDDELTEHVREQLAAFKAPRAYLRTPALPRTASGKIDRAAITDQIKRWLADS